ncbi:HYC_CC_PP family protein [Algoriphagus sp. C2-6-M1]|uniref:HYC_CC_PP family protein n=1 Tax=Algoriphagus persicinus TaxID=3108754 RepID=UPI003A5CDB31
MQRHRKISTILLSILVLLSSTSLTFGMHFCMGQLESIALFSEAKPCDMHLMKSQNASEKHDPDCDHELAEKSCCEDHSIVTEGSKELSIITPVSAPDFHMTAFLYAVVSFMFIAPEADYNTFRDYSPPLIDRDIVVLVQSLII